MDKKAVEYPAECYVALLVRSTKSTNSAERKKMSEQFFRLIMGRGFLHRIFSHTFYWWTWQRQMEKKSPPNKQFIPHHLSRGKSRSAKKGDSQNSFFPWKPKLYFSVWFVDGVSSLFVAVASTEWTWWKFQRKRGCFELRNKLND